MGYKGGGDEQRGTSQRLGDRSNGAQLGITSEGPSLMVSYRQPYINTLDGSELRVELYIG